MIWDLTTSQYMMSRRNSVNNNSGPLEAYGGFSKGDQQGGSYNNPDKKMAKLWTRMAAVWGVRDRQRWLILQR